MYQQFQQGTIGEIKPKKVDIIWNSTLVCIWDCEICCVNAVAVSRKGNDIYIFDPGRKTRNIIPFQQDSGSIYDQAKVFREHSGLELSYEGKLRVLDHLSGFFPKLDFSGGDPLSVHENWKIMEIASGRFGRSQITLTATGAGLKGYNPEEIAPYIGELNFTYDSPDHDGGETRPDGYASGNLKRAAEFVQHGVKTRGECPLSVYNCGDEVLRRIYQNLHDAGVNKLLIMRLFPSGRGKLRQKDIPTPQQYRHAIAVLREEEARLGGPQVKLQCALKFFDNSSVEVNPCDLMEESFGLMADGTLLASPWAIDSVGRPLSDEWVLGNLAETPLSNLLRTEKASEYQRRLNENHGHCKIFSFFNSRKPRIMDRIFDTADPLYVNKEEEIASRTAL